MKYPAISIVAPSGQNIANGRKTLEIRSWSPEQLPLKNLVIVENKKYLYQKDDEELGWVVAIVDVESIHPWQQCEVDAACASAWHDGYFAWVLSNIRPIDPLIQTHAKRKIYFIDIPYP